MGSASAWLAVLALLLHGFVAAQPSFAAAGLTGADGKFLPMELCAQAQDGHGRPDTPHGDGRLHCILCQAGDARTWLTLPSSPGIAGPTGRVVAAADGISGPLASEPSDTGLPQARAPPQGILA